MAYHSVNILLELANDLPFLHDVRARKCSMFLHALDYAPGMDELDPADWRELKEGLRALHDGPGETTRIGEPLRELAVQVLGRQIAEWERLGRPSCHEDWMRAKYPEVDDEGDGTAAQ